METTKTSGVRAWAARWTAVRSRLLTASAQTPVHLTPGFLMVSNLAEYQYATLGEGGGWRVGTEPGVASRCGRSRHAERERRQKLRQAMAIGAAGDALGLVFTDIEGSSALWERLGDQFMAAVEAHNRLISEACKQHGGTVVKEEGDAFFLVFPSAAATVAFALEAQDRLREHPWAAAEHPELQVRMGLHHGRPIPRGNDYFGPDVNRTARICDAGHGGQVLVSEALLEACGEQDESIVVTDIGRHRLRGLAEAQHLYQLTRTDWDRQTWPVLRTLDHVPTNLPAQVTSFIGREHDLEALATLFDIPEERLITLTGPGGSGKSRLAQRAAGEALQHFPDGVFWVELAPLTTPESVPGAIAGALGLQLLPEVRPLETLAVHLREREVLLALDNMEQVIEAADFLAQLLSRVPKLRLLVTSREVLRIPGEHVCEVLPLPLPTPPVNLNTLSQFESVRLFVERAQAAAPGFALTVDNAASIAELCLRLDGIPLALELAAAWTRVLTPAQILEQLGPGSRVLSSRVRGVAERQRTLRESIEWSYRLLDEPDREAFRRLAVFHDGFFLDAAETVCGRGALLSVSNLRDRSLLLSREALGQQQYYLLETVREFAGQQLASEGEEDEARERHAEHYAGVAERLRAVFGAAEAEPYWAEYRLEALNLLEAFRSEVAAQRTERLGSLLSTVVPLRRCTAHDELIRAYLGAAASLARRQRGVIWTAAWAVDLMAAESWHQVLAKAPDCVDACDAAGDVVNAKWCVALAVSRASLGGDWSAAKFWVGEAERRGATGHPHLPLALSSHYSKMGAHEHATELLRAHVAGLGPVDAWRRQYAVSQLAATMTAAGDFSAARETAGQALALEPGARHGFHAAAATSRAYCARALAAGGPLDEARAVLSEAVSILATHLRGTSDYGFYATGVLRAGVAADLPDVVLELPDVVDSPWPPFALADRVLQSLAAALSEACARCDRPDGARRYALITLDYSRGSEIDDYQARELLRHLGWPLLALGHPTQAAICASLAKRLSFDQPEMLRQCEPLLTAVAEALPEGADRCPDTSDLTATEVLEQVRQVLAV